MVAVVDRSHHGQGLSRLLVEAMRDLAGYAGFDSLIAPVRPTWKERYPLIPMEDYVHWTRDDGLPYDPWLRVHARIGGELLEVCPESMVIEGTQDEWESWTGMHFPEDGATSLRAGSSRWSSPAAAARTSSRTCGCGTGSEVGEPRTEPDARDPADHPEEQRLEPERGRSPERRDVAADDEADEAAQADDFPHVALEATPRDREGVLRASWAWTL